MYLPLSVPYLSFGDDQVGEVLGWKGSLASNLIQIAGMREVMGSSCSSSIQQPQIVSKTWPVSMLNALLFFTCKIRWPSLLGQPAWSTEPSFPSPLFTGTNKTVWKRFGFALSLYIGNASRNSSGQCQVPGCLSLACVWKAHTLMYSTSIYWVPTMYQALGSVEPVTSHLPHPGQLVNLQWSLIRASSAWQKRKSPTLSRKGPAPSYKVGSWMALRPWLGIQFSWWSRKPLPHSLNETLCYVFYMPYPI